MRDTERFPTKFGPATTRMPPLPNLRGKRKSTWKASEPAGRVLPEKKGQPMRGPKGPRFSGDKHYHARKKAARQTAHESRRLNRRVS